MRRRREFDAVANLLDALLEVVRVISEEATVTERQFRKSRKERGGLEVLLAEKLGNVRALADRALALVVGITR